MYRSHKVDSICTNTYRSYYLINLKKSATKCWITLHVYVAIILLVQTKNSN
jgi:hypothetical protein